MSDTTAQPGRLTELANPTRFLSLSGRLLPWLAGAAALTVGAGLAMGYMAPEDYQQGITVRIMYIHVPFAWLAMMCYTVMAASALGTLVWRHPLADVSLKAAAPVGAAFTALALATGSIWGKPMWGTWWVWDARLTSVFVLFLMYLGIIALTRAMDDASKSARAAAILTLVGFVNIPIIKFSVDWWNTLHQPASVMRIGGPAIHSSMLTPLLIMAIAFKLYYIWVLLARMEGEIVAGKVRARRLKRVHGGPMPSGTFAAEAER